MEAELVVQGRDGDRAAFAVLADRILDRFGAVALRILRDIDAAQDATQQALVTVWRDLPVGTADLVPGPGLGPGARL